MTDWEPKESDIAFVKRQIRLLRDGGTWGVPCSMSLFTFYHSKKEYVLIGDEDDETNQRTVKILGMIGWKERPDA